MSTQDENTRFLVENRFTKTQAKLYLALLDNGKATAKTLQRKTRVPGPAVYRVLGELQEKGFVVKEVGTPTLFEATPFDQVMQILVKQKMQECRKMEKKAKEFLKESQLSKEMGQEQDYRLVMLNGKERIIQKIGELLNNSRLTLDVISTLSRWLQVVEACYDSYIAALKRGIKCRLIIETSTPEVSLPENIQAMLDEPKLKLKISSDFGDTNSAVFDRNEAIFNFYPSKVLAESPIIWTNHPTFLSMAQDHFEKSWRSATEYRSKPKCVERSPFP